MILVYAPYPTPALGANGWIRRIAAVDRILADRERAYVFPGVPAWRDGRPDYRVNTEQVAPGATMTWLDLRLTNHHRHLSELVERAEFVYAHTSHSSQHLLPYYGTGKIVTDLHGIAPEEETMQGHPGRAAFFAALEETMVRQSAALVTVTDAMADHLRRKFPGLATPTVLLPIVEDLGAGLPLDRPARPKPRVVYVGGLQSWQGIDRMLEVALACRDRFEFRCYTNAPRELKARARRAGLGRELRVGTVPPERLAAVYATADYGFVLRDDCAVNRVSCPTKLSEYLACGVVPIVSLVEIGDFAAQGYAHVTVDDLLAGRVPGADELPAMRRRNRDVFEGIQRAFRQGAQRLRDWPATPRGRAAGSALLTSVERSAYYPLRGVQLTLEHDGGATCVALDDLVAATCDQEVVLDDAGPLRRVRLRTGEAPLLTAPIVLEIRDRAGRVTQATFADGVVCDSHGNWLFATGGREIATPELDVREPVAVRLRLQCVLVGFEVALATAGGPTSEPGAPPVANGNAAPRSLAQAVRRRLANAPFARTMLSAWHGLRRRGGRATY